MEYQTMHNSPSAGKITEEVLNSAVHGLGAIAGVVGLVIGMVNITGPATAKIGFIVYSVSLILLMTMSSLYHALYFSRAKPVFQKLDHSSILILIAGSYTPFVLYLFSGWLLVAMLVFVWAIAVVGIVIKTAMPLTSKRVGAWLYIGFGWLAIMLVPKLSQLDVSTVLLLASGGLLYTFGAGIMALKKPFTHFGWHVMVVLAACLHYFAIIQL